MTIRELIEKIGLECQRKYFEGNAESNGSYGALESIYNGMENCESIEMLDHFDSCISGMLYGLRAVYYITQEEHEQMKKELEKMFDKNEKRIHQKQKQNSILSKLNENKRVLDAKDVIDKPVERRKEVEQCQV